MATILHHATPSSQTKSVSAAGRNNLKNNKQTTCSHDQKQQA
jgi:hypothetical protein